MRYLLLFVTTLLFGRINPFVPVVTNNNKTIIKKSYFSSKKLTLPNDIRVLKKIKIEYQTLSGAIKEVVFPVDKAVDWHNPILVKSISKKLKSQQIKVSFLNFDIYNQKVKLFTKDKIIRKFLLVEPFRFVVDFKADKNFLSYTKKLNNSFIKKIAIGNHSGFYRVVFYLDAKYKTDVKKIDKGYLIEFK